MLAGGPGSLTAIIELADCGCPVPTAGNYELGGSASTGVSGRHADVAERRAGLCLGIWTAHLLKAAPQCADKLEHVEHWLERILLALH